MVLTGLFALAAALCLWPSSASADPVSAVLVGMVLAAGAPGFATAVAVTTFILTTTLSLAISYAASALLRPSAAGKSAATPLQSTPYGAKVTSKSPDQAHAIIFGRTRVGAVAYPIAATDVNHNLHTCLLVTGHKINGFKQLWIGDEVFEVADMVANDGYIPASTGSKYAGYVRGFFHNGDPNQAADAHMVDEIPEWTVDHRGRGLAYANLRFRFGPKGPQPPLFSDGVPNVTPVLEGVCEAYDPRDGTYKYTTNPALLAAWFLCNADYGFGLAYATSLKGPAPDYPGEAALIAAANACDETVTKADGSTGPRYTCNGALLSSQPKQDILGRILGAMAGWRAYDGETHFLYAGVYHAPTESFTNDDLRGQGMVIDSVSPIGELWNTVRGKFFGEVNNWQSSDFPTVVGATYLSQDGREIAADIELPLTNDPEMAQRIAKIHLEKSRRQYKVKAPCKFTAWRTMAGATIAWTETVRRGWSAKPFEVRQCDYVVEVQDGAASLNVDLQLQETAPGVYSWTSTDATILAEVPRTTLPDPMTVASPSNLVALEDIYVGRDGAGVKTSAVLTWQESPDAFVVDYEVAYKLRSDSVYTVLSRIKATTLTLYDLAPGSYDFQVAACNYLGAVSASVPATAELTGLLAPPQAPTNMTLTAMGGSAYIRFDETVDLDVKHGGWIVFRHSPATSGATWDTASPLDKLEGRSTHAWLALKAGTYLARFLDSSGRYSTTAASVVSKQSSVLGFTPAAGGSLQEDATFTGTKTNCSVASSKLGLTAGQASGTYLWHAKMDLGSVKNVRVTVSQSTEVENATDTWDSSDLSDSDESWDAAVSGNEAWAVTYVRTTDTDPAGSPTWSDWMRLDAGEFAARGLDFKTELVAVDVNFVVKISALAALAEEVV